MASKKKSSPLRTALRVALLFSNAYVVVRDLIALMSLEVKIARKTIGLMIVLLIFLLIIGLTSWICLMGLLLMYLLSLQWSIPIVLTVLLSLNIVIMLLITLMLTRAAKKLSFSITREQCLLIYNKITNS